MTALPERMAGVQLTRHGGPEALVWNDAIPVPAPGPGEALVRVLAAGVNNTDINTRTGWYAREVRGATGTATAPEAAAGGWSGGLRFPRIQGADLCGRVVALGPGAEGPPVGARVTCPTNQPEPTEENPVAIRVIGSEYDGAFAQFCVVPCRQLYDVSASPLSDVEIAAMPCAWGTAEALLDRAAVGAGDRVLVTGASGGVGLAAVTLARLRGAEVTGVAARAKHEAVRAAGAADAARSRRGAAGRQRRRRHRSGRRAGLGRGDRRAPPRRPLCRGRRHRRADRRGGPAHDLSARPDALRLHPSVAGGVRAASSS